MSDETTGGTGKGDPVTFVDTNGVKHRAICTAVHGQSTISVVHRFDGGGFGEWGTGKFVEKTSVSEATDPEDEYFVFIDGWSA